MANSADDLGIPMKPARPVSPAAEPPRTNSSFPTGPAAGTPLPPIPNFLRPSAQPATAAVPPHPGTDEAIGLGDTTVEARKLIVGQGISLSGEINSCDRLVVEGSVRANLQQCRHMMIAETGLFDGNAAIDDAEVHGRFEGDLIVHKRLLIRATGRVSGTITYGQIEIEAGGKISGTIQAP